MLDARVSVNDKGEEDSEGSVDVGVEVPEVVDATVIAGRNLPSGPLLCVQPAEHQCSDETAEKMSEICVQLAEGHCSDEAAEKMSEVCVQLAGDCSGNEAEKMSGFCT